MAGKNDFPTNPHDSINAYDFGGQLLSSGLTKREYFTALFMQTALSFEARGSDAYLGNMGRIATRAADKLIEALNIPTNL